MSRGQTMKLKPRSGWAIEAPKSMGELRGRRVVRGIVRFTTTRDVDEHGTFDVLAAGPLESKCPEFPDWLEQSLIRRIRVSANRSAASSRSRLPS